MHHHLKHFNYIHLLLLLQGIHILTSRVGRIQIHRINQHNLGSEGLEKVLTLSTDIDLDPEMRIKDGQNLQDTGGYSPMVLG
jgi:hypothetical protein